MVIGTVTAAARGRDGAPRLRPSLDAGETVADAAAELGAYFARRD